MSCASKFICEENKELNGIEVFLLLGPFFFSSEALNFPLDLEIPTPIQTGLTKRSEASFCQLSRCLENSSFGDTCRLIVLT